MNLFQLQSATKAFGLKVLFENATFAINQGEHVGVVGPNGAGKTTLFKILVGEEHLDSGDYIKMQGLRIGYLEQESDWRLDMTSAAYLEQNCHRPLWELRELGASLGLHTSHFESPLAMLSGGYKMRMKLLYLIGLEPDVMFLDEPTNFLDLESVLALENFLQSHNGAFLLISHDREFLRRTTDHTLEVESGDITKFPGSIDDYLEQKEQLRTILEAQASNQENKRRHIQNFVDRFRAKATKARQAQSRLKQLEKMEAITMKPVSVRAQIRIPSPVRTGREVIHLSKADLGYEQTRILQDVNIRLERGDHLGVVGINGAGKSTLLKSLAGEIPLLSGQRELGYQVAFSYFSQHTAEKLNSRDTVFDSLSDCAHPDLNRQDVLNVAGSLLFSGDDIHKKIGVLSGGERSRVALGQVLLQRSPLLLLDEPTNHLDFDTVEALTEALCEYEGSVVLVSHDRGFIGRVSTRILEINNGHAELYPGSYDEYVWSVQKGALSKRNANAASSSGSIPASLVMASNPLIKTADIPSAKLPSLKELQLQIKEKKRKIREIEAELTKQENQRDQLAQQLTTAEGLQAGDVAKQLSTCSLAIESLESDLLSLLEAIEKIEALFPQKL